MLLSPVRVMGMVVFGVLCVVAILSLNVHKKAARDWAFEHRRVVSVSRLENGGLGPELARVDASLMQLDKKLEVFWSADAAQALGDGGDGASQNNATAVKTSRVRPYVRPRRTVLPPPAFTLRQSEAAHRLVKDGVEDTIFVSIASYRDEQCAPTILDMFAKAKRPEALFIGAVEQHFPGDPPCTPKEFIACQSAAGFCPTDHIQVRRISPSKARGPTFGRFYGMLMYRGESYLFMMDSHNRFVTNWDNIIVRMYRGLPTSKGVLSHYPEAWNNPEDGEATNAPLDDRKTTTYLCTAKYINEGFPRLDGFVVHRTTKPRPQPWAAAGFLFADARIILDVPFDPHLNYIFDGEEILYSVRMWTKGWDIFSPNENIMYHYYYRKKAKKFWSLLPSDWITHRDRALRRIQYLLNVTKSGTSERVVPVDTTEEYVIKDLDRYGLGTDRTLAEYYAFAGIDPVQRKIENKFCPRA